MDVLLVCLGVGDGRKLDSEDLKDFYFSYALNLFLVQDIQKGESAHSLFLELRSIYSCSGVLSQSRVF